MRGRKPKPVEQKVMEGNPGHRDLPEVVLVSGRPELGELAEPPAHLNADARGFWVTSVERLVEVGIIDRVDVPVLEMLATQYARWRQASRVVDEFGHFTRGSVGQLREHPAVKIEREAHQLFLKTAEHYALTPIARTRLGLAELHKRSLQAEMRGALGAPVLTPVGHTTEEPITDAEVVDADR